MPLNCSQKLQASDCGDSLWPHRQVLEFDAKGSVHNTVVTPSMLGLQPRDVSLFKTTGGPGKQRATISVREGRILFRSEHCQAIVVEDRAYLFPGKCDSLESLCNPVNRAGSSVVAFALTLLRLIVSISAPASASGNHPF